jgi:hypothetical protein
MKFILVNGRSPSPQSFCALCCEPIGESYLREVATRISYCDYRCYAGHCIIADRALKNYARAS